MAEQPPASYGLFELKEWLRRRLQGGVKCPVCDQHAQMYRRAITRSMVASMAKLLEAQESRGEETDTWSFVHLPDIPQRSRDTTMLRYWGLIEEEDSVRPDGGRSGYWRCTLTGKRWLGGYVGVPKYALVYNGEVQERYGDYTYVHDVVARFDLREAREA